MPSTAGTTFHRGVLNKSRFRSTGSGFCGFRAALCLPETVRIMHIGLILSNRKCNRSGNKDFTGGDIHKTLQERHTESGTAAI
jgi:hypothetical protein